MSEECDVGDYGLYGVRVLHSCDEMKVVFTSREKYSPAFQVKDNSHKNVKTEHLVQKVGI